MSARRLCVHVGYDRNGRERVRLFATLEDACKFLNAVFLRTGKVLSVVERAK